MCFLLPWKIPWCETGKEARRTMVSVSLTSVRCKKNRGRFVFTSCKAQPVFIFRGLNYRDGPRGISSLPETLPRVIDKRLPEFCVVERVGSRLGIQPLRGFAFSCKNSPRGPSPYYVE